MMFPEFFHPTCSCEINECEGERDVGDPKRCQWCAELDCELPCPADMATWVD